MNLPTITELIGAAPPVYRCMHCLRRYEDHRGPSLHCPDGGCYEVILYESHQRAKEAA